MVLIHWSLPLKSLYRNRDAMTQDESLASRYRDWSHFVKNLIRESCPYWLHKGMGHVLYKNMNSWNWSVTCHKTIFRVYNWKLLINFRISPFYIAHMYLVPMSIGTKFPCQVKMWIWWLTLQILCEKWRNNVPFNNGLAVVINLAGVA